MNAIASSTQEEQPFLFSDSELGLTKRLIDQVKHYECNAKGAGIDQHLCFAIVERYAMGFSRRSIATVFRVSWELVDAVITEAETSGKIVGIRNRLTKKFGALAESCVEQITERVANGTMSDHALTMTMGISFDKWAALSGQPSAIVGHVDMKRIDVDHLNGLVLSLPRAPVIDIQPVASRESGEQKSLSAPIQSFNQESSPPGPERELAVAPSLPTDTQSTDPAP